MQKMVTPVDNAKSGQARKPGIPGPGHMRSPSVPSCQKCFAKVAGFGIYGCSSPSPGAMRITKTKCATIVSTGGVGGRDFAIKLKNMWFLLLFTLVLCNIGPQTASGHNFCTIVVSLIFRSVRGDGLLQIYGRKRLKQAIDRTSFGRKPVPVCWARPSKSRPSMAVTGRDTPASRMQSFDTRKVWPLLPIENPRGPKTPQPRPKPLKPSQKSPPKPGGVGGFGGLCGGFRISAAGYR
jgi:hypothetical protein